MEAAGLLGTDLFLMFAQQELQLPAYESIIVHLCDNLEAVNRYNTAQRRHTTDFGIHDMDIHMAIAENQSNIPNRKAKWIKGHQDEMDGPLSDDAQLNVEVDALADEFMLTNPPFLPPPPTVSLFYRHTPITWNARRFLHRHHGEQTLRKHILEHHHTWTDDTFDSIPWQSIKSALDKLEDYQRTQIIKFSHGWSPTATRINDWDKSVNPRCPNCQRTNRLPSPYDETEDHILRCPHPVLLEARLTSLAKLERTLDFLDTPKDVSTALLFGITSWFDNEQYNGEEPPISWPPPNFPYHPQHHEPIRHAFEHQSEIGWDEFLRGRISNKWGPIIQQYYRNMNLGARRNCTTWEVQTIHATWHIFLNTWQARNNLLHGANDTENKAIRLIDMDQQIRNAYRLDQNQVAPIHQGLFTSLTETLNLNFNTKINWLHSIRSAKSAWINLLHQDAQDAAGTLANPP